MRKFRNTARQPLLVDALEDRVVLSTASAVSVVTGATPSSITTELNTVGAQINNAYASFASAIRQAESTYYSGITGTGSTGTGTTGLATLQSQITQQTTTLTQSLTTAVGGLTGQTSSISNLLQAQVSGTSGSLATQMNSLLSVATAGSSTGAVAESSIPLLISTIESEMSQSYSATAVNVYYYATGQEVSTTSSGSSSSSIDLTKVATAQNTAYSTFATAIRQAETTLVSSTTSSGTTSPTGTVASVNATIGIQVQTLSDALTTELSSTSDSSDLGPLQASLTGSAAGTLATELTNLVRAAGTSGTIAQADLPLLFQAVDNAIAASYNATSIDNYLLASSFSSSSTGTGTTTGTGTMGTSGY